MSSRLATALRLKEIATNTMVKFTPTVPPESFLYRGNAYMALGQPYFAMVDYDLAEVEVMGLSGMHHHHCKKALGTLPNKVTGVFPAVTISKEVLADAACADCVEVRLGPSIEKVAEGGIHSANSTVATVWASDGPGPDSVRIVSEEDTETPSSSTRAPVDAPPEAPLECPVAAELLCEDFAYQWRVFARETVKGTDRKSEVIPAHTPLINRHKNFIGYPLQKELCSFCCNPLRARHFLCENDRCHEEYCSRECRFSAKTRYHGSVCNTLVVQELELQLYDQYEAATSRGMRRHFAALLLSLRVMGFALGSNMLPSSLNEMRHLPGRLTFNPHTFQKDVVAPYHKFVKSTKTLNMFCVEEFLGVYARVLSNAVINEDWAILSVPGSTPRVVPKGDPRANALRADDGSILSSCDIQPGAEILVEDLL